jgi:carboxymethylenebutenolidase
MEQVIDAIKRQDERIEKVVLVGFCWGGTTVLQMSAQSNVDLVVSCHPGQVKIPADLEALKTPVMFIFAERDLFLASDIKEQVSRVLVRKDLAYRVILFDFNG